MTDIVRTIQAEQDRIIRADARGVLVVQGGPGTGKTAVALHRAAYLLYTHRERLARSGLLIVGPSPTFLRYIADVLPSLGETGVVLADLGRLRPGLQAEGTEAPEVAEIKGRLAMADVVAAAVRDRQAVLGRTGRGDHRRRPAALHQGRRRPGAARGTDGVPAAQRGPARRGAHGGRAAGPQVRRQAGRGRARRRQPARAAAISRRCAARSPPSRRCTR